MALFGPSDGSSREPKSLVEFKAGKMKLEDTSHMVVPDKRKGLVFMKLDNYGLLHFYWKDRQSGRTEDDLIIFPDDAEMKRVPQCTTGRVYILHFKNSKRKFFYWMQEPNEAKDLDLIQKVNDLINNPPDPSAASEEEIAIDSGALQALLGGGGADREHLLELLQSGRLSQLMSPLTGGRGGGSRAQSSSADSRTSTHAGGSSSSSSTTVAATATQQPSHSTTSARQARPQLQLSDLQTALTSMGMVPGSNAAADTATTSQQPQVGLSQAITGDALRQAVDDTFAAEQLQPLLPDTGEDVAAIVTSPQFRQALGAFDTALQSGQLGPLVAQFGLGQDAVQAANHGDPAAFAVALQNEQMSQSEGTGSGDPVEGDNNNGDQAGGGHQLEGNAMEEDDQQPPPTNEDDDDDTMSVD